MAIINVDLLNSDQVIDSDNSDESNTINLTAVGSHTLTVNGVSATTTSFANVQAFASPTFSVVNDGSLTINYGALGAGALSAVTYNISDPSSIAVQGPSILGLSLGTQTINFSGNGFASFSYAKGIVDTVSQFNVTGFSWGDSLGVDGYQFDSFAYDSLAGSASLTLTNGAIIGEQTVTFNLNGISAELASAIQADPASFVGNDGQFVAPVCFLRGTQIDIEGGTKPVEQIRAGDRVLCLNGIREVRWVGYRHEWVSRIPNAHLSDMWPILIKRDAISDNVPSSDIRVSPWHHLYIDGVLVRAKDLVNDDTIKRDQNHYRLSYYHLELDQFDVIRAHGVYSESYTDGGNRNFFHNADVTRLDIHLQARREGTRPGFQTVRDKTIIEILQKRFAARASDMTSDQGSYLRHA